MPYYGTPVEIVPQMREKISSGVGFWLVVTCSSMYPTLLHKSDSMFIEPLKQGLAVGDIPLVLTEDCHCILHRVIHIDHNVFFMQGDALSNR